MRFIVHHFSYVRVLSHDDVTNYVWSYMWELLSAGV